MSKSYTTSNIILLYISTVLIWGSSWLAIHYQVNSNVEPIWSTIYRFFPSGILLLIYSYKKAKIIRLSVQQHLLLALQGLFLFCLNFIFSYYATMLLVSGIIPVISSTIVLMNIFNGKVFLKRPVVLSHVIGAIIGIIGAVIIFKNSAIIDFTDEFEHKFLLIGLFFALIATYCSSVGQMVCVYNENTQKIPIEQTTALSMLYGAVISLIIAYLLNIRPSFDTSLMYISSLLYLTLLASIIGFSSYLYLLVKIGPEKTSYMFVVFPVIALLLSSIFEQFVWNKYIFIGLFFIILGNIFISLSPKTS